MASGGIPVRSPLVVDRNIAASARLPSSAGFYNFAELGLLFRIFIFVFIFAAEDVEMKERRHQEVRNVHQLVNVEVNGGAGEHVGLLARQPPGPNQVINHVERSIPRRERQILAKLSRSNWKVVIPNCVASPFLSPNLTTKVVFISIVVPEISPSPCA